MNKHELYWSYIREAALKGELGATTDAETALRTATELCPYDAPLAPKIRRDLAKARADVRRKDPQ